MFEIDSAATEYIRKRCQGAVTIVLDYQPMMGGGWKCPSARDVAGSYVPRLLTGAPTDEADPYLLWQAGDVRVFYPARLQLRPGADRIRIRLRNVLLMQWLELEGARSIVSAPAEESV